MVQKRSWYEIVEGDEILQGDFFRHCPILQPPSGFPDPHQMQSGMTIPVKVQTYDIVVMSQSCDLVQRKLNLVLVCPHWSLSELENKDSRFTHSKMKEEIRRGNVPAYHMLASCDLEGFEREIQIVDFRTVFSVPFDFLVEQARRQGNRLRLLSPYREHLSQAFARFFMRVGLPADIPPFR